MLLVTVVQICTFIYHAHHLSVVHNMDVTLDSPGEPFIKYPLKWDFTSTNTATLAMVFYLYFNSVQCSKGMAISLQFGIFMYKANAYVPIR